MRRHFVAGLLVVSLALTGAEAAPIGKLHAARPVQLSHRQTVSTLLAHLTLRQKVGQMMMVSFPGTSFSPQTERILSAIQPGGLTLFGPNFASPAQLKALDSSLQKHSHVPLLISVDQEGGQVDRVTSGVRQMPSEAQYGQINNPKLVRNDASTEAAQLRNLGINMDLAPVLDVATPDSIIGSEQRSYGNNAFEDAQLGRAAIQGYQSRGLAAVAKHVVGLGTTTVNPETTLPTLNMSAAELQRQLSPFRTAQRSGVDGMMITHVIIIGVTAPHTPASLSYRVVNGILRHDLHYWGILMTDSLTMGAVTARFGLGRACTMAIGAGEDILLITPGAINDLNQLMSTADSIVSKVRSGSIPMKSINASVRRVLKLKQKLHLPLPSR